MANFLLVLICFLLTNPVAAQYYHHRQVASLITSRFDVNVTIDRVEDDIFDGAGYHVSVEAELLPEFQDAARLAYAAMQALYSPNVHNHPAYVAIFGRQRNPWATVTYLRRMYERIVALFDELEGREIHVQALSGHGIQAETGDWYDAEVTEGDVILLYENFWQSDPMRHLTRRLRRTTITAGQNPERALDSVAGYRAVTLLHELTHTTYVDIAGRILDSTTDPPEFYGAAEVLRMAVADPENSINNPDSLAMFAVAIYSNIFVQDPSIITRSRLARNSSVAPIMEPHRRIAYTEPPALNPRLWGAMQGSGGSCGG